MMKHKRKAAVMILACVGLVVFTSGCGDRMRRAGARRGTTRHDDVVGMLEQDIHGYPLGDRMEGISEYAGQFEVVYFAFDSSRIDASERAKIEAVADYMRRNPKAGVIIEGHCDERGSREYNLALGERRALAARAYLIGLGVDGARIQTKSYGEERPAALGHNESAWRLNRRAEFVLTY